MTFGKTAGIAFAGVFAMTATIASAASHSFTNSFGRWSDATNWDTGAVPGGVADYAVFSKGGHITNDVPGLKIGKITIAAETHLYGESIEVGGTTELNLGGKHLYFHCPTVITNGVRFTNGGGASVNFCNTNTIVLPDGALTTSFNMRVGEFATGNVTNHSAAPLDMRTTTGADGYAVKLFTSGGVHAVQDISNLKVDNGVISFDTSNDALLRVDEHNVPGDVRYLGGNHEITDSRANGEGALRIFNATKVTLARAAAVRPAAGPVVHLDASLTNNFEYLDGDPDKGIVKWKGVKGRGYAAHDGQLTEAGTRALPTLQLDKLNGLPWVDFGAYNQGYHLVSQSARAKAPYLVMQCGADADFNVYTLFVVAAAQNFIVGAKSSNSIIHGIDSWTGALASNRNETHADFKDYSAWVRMDGADTTAFTCNRSGQNHPNLFSIRMANSPL